MRVDSMAPATKDEAGVYEVAGEMWSDLDPGDWGHIRTGQCRMIFATRRPGDGSLPILDWGAHFVEDGQLVRVRCRIHKEVFERHFHLRRETWETAAMRFSYDMTASELRVPLQRAITECPGAPTDAFVQLVSRPVTMGDLLGAWRCTHALVVSDAPREAVNEALDALEREGVIEGRLLTTPDSWGRNDTRRWYAA